MADTSLVKRALAPAWVRPEALNVTSGLLGAPLAPHGRRAAAMGVDVAIIGLPFWWKGQTVGKRLFGLRVVHLAGKRLGVLDCFGRYGGYAAGLATGGIGLLQVLWDPNRQAVEDKLAHTVVIDLRGPRAPPADDPPAA